MLVSQYIYTACGKDRTGAFSVFSKSKDITDAESAEIREMMMYKTPSGLPYEPTEQEIEDLFPKKFGYFFLSSKRACLAQVCYVGRVYSELDSRVGNYIIHAFVFEKSGNFVPYSFIEHAEFKRLLKREEWHDSPIPDELPQIQIPESSEVTANEITDFFDEERKNKLKLLVEAIVNSSSEKTVCFCDEHKNIKYWFKALSVCLPKTIQNEVSFCTHFTNTLLPGNISSRIQLRVNQPDSSMFNYAQEAQKGRYVFDFKKNIFPASLKAGKYADSIVKLLSSDMLDTEKFLNDIKETMSKYSVNINEAADLVNIGKANYTDTECLEVIFSVPYDKIYDWGQEKLDKIKAVYDAVPASDLKPETNELAIITFQKDKTDFDKISSNKSIDIFIDYYFHYAVAEVNEIEKFRKVFELGDIDKIVEKLVKEPKIDFVLYIFKKLLLNSPDMFDKKLGEIAEKYFEKLSSGERKTLFAVLLGLAKSAEENTQFKSYFEKFNKEHKEGFFSFFKGKK